MEDNIAERLKAAFDSVDLVCGIDRDSILDDPDAGTIGRKSIEIATSAIQERLDIVFGIDGWETFVEALTNIGGQTGFQCLLRAHFHTGKSITKTGVGVSDSGDANDAMKKAFHSAARLFGVGRYLGTLEEEWVALSDDDLLDLGFEPSGNDAETPSVGHRKGLSQAELEEDIPIGLPHVDGQAEIPLGDIGSDQVKGKKPPLVKSEEGNDLVDDRVMAFRNLPPSRPRPDYPH